MSILTLLPGICFLSLLQLSYGSNLSELLNHEVDYILLHSILWISKSLLSLSWNEEQLGKLRQQRNLSSVLWVGYYDVTVESCLEFHPFLEWVREDCLYISIHYFGAKYKQFSNSPLF